MAVWSLSAKRRHERRAKVEEERPSLTTLDTDTLLMRNVAIPNAIWTLGAAEHGQCGHASGNTGSASLNNAAPLPAALNLSTLRDGVRTVHAGPYCTLIVTNTGEAIGFGTGPFRLASDASAEKPPSTLAYEGAPPFRVESSYLEARINARAGERSTPISMTGLLMPVAMVTGGEDFCVALMQNGLVFAWGDGDEGKLGLGQHRSYEKPTMVDSLLPTAYAEVAKQSEHKDELLKGGARLIRTRGSAFQVTFLACGARHTLALTTTQEVFTWGSGCCGQLGHGSRQDELLPRPITGLHKSKELRAHAIAAGSYHSAAIIGFSRSGKGKPPQLFTWGDGQSGRLGLGDDYTRSVPNEVCYHRVKPRGHVRSKEDSRDSGSLFSFRRTDWLSNESGHALEWATLAMGGHHSAALTQSGQVYTWGADDYNQLGHSGDAMQRLPCLLTSLVRDDPNTRRRERVPITDVHELGCGRRFTVALTWGGEVWVWGELGGRRLSKPTVIERLLDATIVRLACGFEHVALLTGDPAMERQRVASFHTDEQRAAALMREQQSLDERRQRDQQQQEEAVARLAQLKAERLAEKRRVKLLAKLDKQRQRQAGTDPKKEAEEKARKQKAKQEMLKDAAEQNATQEMANAKPGKARAAGKK